MRAVLWTIGLLLLFVFGVAFFVTHLALFVWVGVVVALCLAFYGIIASRRARHYEG